ncbi:hypothetical protein GCM10010123_05390 [Pilimelia anulata]|uniref:Uncharacterized protein n=1 Tax=Pilimelia anulata TaxID=53371 RepID=A0A8J3AZG4_9ACTN|nr:hypothetical protein [Pilimelia anulata]GGJ78325.1 hypothetical protein GCM10010123_05390 [Pilimelia anulata]
MDAARDRTRSGRSALRAVGACAALVALLATGSDVRPTPRSSAAARVEARPGQSAAPSPVPLDALFAWRSVVRAGMPNTGFAGGNGHGMYVAPANPRSRTAVFVEAATGRVVARVDPPAGREIHNVRFAGNYAIVAEDSALTAGAPPRSRVRLLRVDLRTGRQQAVPAHPAHTGPWSVVGDTLYHESADPRTDTWCVSTLIVPTLATATLHCPAAGASVSGVEVTGAGIGFTETDPHGCPRNVLLDPRGGTRTVLPSMSRACTAAGALDLAGTPVWVEQPDLENADEGRIWAGLAGRVVPLGDAHPGSLRYCAGHAYWTVAVFAGSGPYEEMRRWRPGGRVEVVHRDARTGAYFGRIDCHGDAITVTGSDADSGLDTLWEAGVPAAGGGRPPVASAARRGLSGAPGTRRWPSSSGR